VTILKEKIQSDLKEALRSKDELRLSVLRMLFSAIHNREIEKRAKTGVVELNDEEMTAVLRSEVKKRKDAIAEFTKGGRLGLAEKESSELKILKAYLPQELNDGEIEKTVQEVIALLGGGTSEFGQIMGEVMKRLKGQASGEKVSTVVKKFLQK